MNPGLPLPCPSARPRGASAHARQGVHLRFSPAVVLTAIQGEADGATGWGQLCRRAPADTQIPFEAIEAGPSTRTGTHRASPAPGSVHHRQRHPAGSCERDCHGPGGSYGSGLDTLPARAGVHHGRPLGWPVDPVGPTVTLLLRTLGIAQSAVAEGDLMSNAELGQRVGSVHHRSSALGRCRGSRRISQRSGALVGCRVVAE